jgi:hypothetical protein
VGPAGLTQSNDFKYLQISETAGPPSNPQGLSQAGVSVDHPPDPLEMRRATSAKGSPNRNSSELGGAEPSKYSPDESVATPVLKADGKVVGFIDEYPTAVHAFNVDGELVGFFGAPPSPASQAER